MSMFVEIGRKKELDRLDRVEDCIVQVEQLVIFHIWILPQRFESSVACLC